MPLLFFTEYVKKRANSNQFGNFVFWLSFVIFGQPMAIILYYHDWVIENRPDILETMKARKP